MGPINLMFNPDFSEPPFRYLNLLFSLSTTCSSLILISTWSWMVLDCRKVARVGSTRSSSMLPAEFFEVDVLLYWVLAGDLCEVSLLDGVLVGDDDV